MKMNADLHLCVLSLSVTDEDTVKRYYAKFEEKFFQTCEKELSKINTFYSGIVFYACPFTFLAEVLISFKFLLILQNFIFVERLLIN